MEPPMGLAERFWSLARGMKLTSLEGNPVACVKHVLEVLDALDRGETGDDLSVHTVSFLALLRESEQQGDMCYASPEQIRGESLDERSLVFSVGVLLFERLTGRHPFGAENNQMRRVARIQRGEMGSGVNYFPNVPAGLRTVLMRAMGPFPEERFASLAELRARLEQFVQDQQTSGYRLPGTTGASRRSSDEATRVVRRSTEFGRDLMAVSASPTRDHLHERRRDRISEMHMRALPDHAHEERNTPARTGRALSPGSANAAPERPARPRAVIVDDEPERRAPAPAAQPAPAADMGARDAHPRASGWIGRLAWLGIGAVIAAAAMMFISRRQSTAPGPATGPAAAAAASAPAPAAVAPSKSRPDAPSLATEATPEPKQQPEERVFAPEAAGERAAQRARTCFTDRQVADVVRFRAGVRFPAHAGGVSRVYFSTSEEITGRQRACVRQQLLGLEAGGIPDTPLVVDYQFRFTAHSARAVMK